jgi:hypothetical protein
VPNASVTVRIVRIPSIQFKMRRAPVIVLDNGASSIKFGVTTSPKDVR